MISLRTLLASAHWFALVLPLLIMATAQAASGNEQRITVLASGDTEGYVGPCRTCPADTGKGGLARRGSMVADHRDRGPVLLLDAGNALFGAESRSSKGRIMTAAYEAIGYDAVNIGYRDFRLGRQATVEAFEDLELTPISANLYDAKADERLFEPFTIHERGGERWAIIGLTERPTGLEVIPHLREQLEGVDIRVPGEVLPEVVADASKAADHLVLLYYGGPVSLKRVIDALDDPAALRAIIAAGGEGEDDAGAHPAVAWTAPHGTHLTKLQPASDAPPAEATIERLALGPAVGADPAVEAVIEPIQRAAEEAEAEAAAPTDPIHERMPDDAEFGTGAAFRLMAEGSSRAMNLAIHRAEIRSSIDGHDAPEDAQFLVLDATWENQLAIDLVFDLGYAEPVLVGDATRQLYLLINGKRVQRLAPQAGHIEGHMPVSFRLSHIGALVEGKLVFAIPDEGIESLSLRYYHDEYAPLVVELFGDEPEVDAEPAVPTQVNDLMEIGVYGVEQPERLDGESPPEGMQWLVVDWRGRSRLTSEADARAVDADAAEDARIDLPRVMEYLEAPALIQAVVDDEYAYVRDPRRSTLLAEPALLPEHMAGGTAVFLVPEDVDWIELVCDFPLFGLATEGMMDQLEPMRFDLVGEPGRTERHDPIGSIPDEPVALSVLDAGRTDRIGEHAADEGRELAVLDVLLENDSDEGGLYELARRVSLRPDADGDARVEGVLLRGGVPAVEPFWLPADGERRRVMLIVSMPQGTTHLEMRYNGISRGGTIELDLDEDAPRIARHRAAAPPHDEEARELARDEVDDQHEPAVDEEDEPAELAEPDEPRLVKQQPTPKVEGESRVGADERLELDATATNDAVRLTLTGATVQDEYDGRSSGRDRRFLVLDTRWEAIGQPPEGEDLPQYALDAIRDHIYAVLNDHRLLPVERVRNVDGLLSSDLEIPDPDADNQSATVEGRLIFVVPEDEPVRKLDLHVFDRAHGGMDLAAISPREAPIGHEPIRPVQHNRVIEAGIYGIETAPRFNGSRPGGGNEWVIVDLRANSRHRIDAVDVLTADEQTLAAVEPLAWFYHWPDWRWHLHLVIDGEHGFTTHSRHHEMHSPARFIPQATTGGRIGFQVPAAMLDEAESVELNMGFEQTAVPGGEPVHAPRALNFILAGERPDRVGPEPIASVQDHHLRVEVLGTDNPEQVGRSTAGDDEQWLIVDLRVTAGEKDTLFDPGSLWLMNEDAARLTAARQTDRLDETAPDDRSPFWLPAGESRRFTLAYRVDSAFSGAPLVYEGQSRMAYLELPGHPAPDNIADLATPGMDMHTDREGDGIESVGLTPEQVNNAIDRGRDYLWEQIKDRDWKDTRGRNVGFVLLALLALVHADAHEDIPELDARLRRFLDWARPTDIGGRSVYATGLLAMLIESYGDPLYLPKLEQCARYLIEDQGPQGSWNYGADVPLRFFPEPDPVPDSPFQVTGGRSLEQPELPEQPLRRTLPWEVNGDGDNSVSQFAILGLWSAKRAGIDIDDEVWRRMLRVMLERQNTDRGGRYGGWGYTRGSSFGSMTAAGVCALAIGMHYIDPDVDPTDDPRVRGGLAWLAQTWKPGTHPERGRDDDQWVYYYTYSVERVGQILGVDFIGKYDWYPAMARFLVDEQGGNGAWTGRSEDDLVATSFAVLTLTRATPSLDVDKEPIERGGSGTIAPVAELRETTNNVYIILDASGTMRGEIDGREKFDVAREAVRRMLDVLPDDVQVALRVTGHRRSPLDEGADEDTALEIPFGRLDKERFNATLDGLRNRGQPALTLSIEQAVRDIQRARTDGRTVAILLTDGGERRYTQRDVDPLEPAEAFGRNDDWHLAVVGFGIDRDDWTEQLVEIARRARGVYRPAARADELIEQMLAIVNPQPPTYHILDEDGNVIVEDATFGDPLELPEGRYTVRSVDGEETVEADFWVNTNRTTRIRFEVSHLPVPEADEGARIVEPASRGATAVEQPTADEDQVEAHRQAPAAADEGDEPRTTPRFCTQCGHRLDEGARFCTQCGHAVGE